SLFSGNVPQCVAGGDLNQDGKPDLCVTNAFDDTFSVFIQREEGFNLAGVYHTGVYPGSGNDLPRELILEDFNGDGQLDVAVANSGHPQLGTRSSLTIFLGLPDGGFFHWGSYLTSVQLQTVFSESIASGDLDGDGWIDLVIGNHNADSLSIFKGIGLGKFAPIAEIPLNGSQRGPHSLAIRDLNFDGKSEIVGVEKRRLFILNKQRGWNFIINFINSPFENSDFRDLEVADVDGDGNWDALVADYTGRLICYYGLKPDGVTIRPADVIELAEFQGLSGIEIGDWDGDAEASEIILTNIIGNSVLVYKLASREIIQSFIVGEKPRFVRFADLNQDRMGDITVVNEGDEFVPQNPDLSLIFNSNVFKENIRLQLTAVMELRDRLPAPICRTVSGIGMY
ncbi:MAG: VCBS repeat-containing protein, partial [Candidatus Sumerlaeia bacterium]|nr:VCBS repeat-containing protein [Candidatus Sumerlaeia bacterium]